MHRMLGKFLFLTATLAQAVRLEYQTIEVITKPSTDCFTQGLLYHRGYLYESCGEYGRSSIRKVDPDHGTILQEMKIPAELFGEGLAAIDQHLYLLTWNEKIMLVLDVDTFTITNRYSYETFTGEGWGLTYDQSQHRFVVSDGSSHLTFFAIPTQQSLEKVSFSGGNVDMESLVKLGEVIVMKKDDSDKDSKDSSKRSSRQNQGQRSNGEEVKLLNELEISPDYLYVYANIWYQNDIVKIEIATGQVVGTIRLPRLYPRRERLPTADCLNGIAYNASTDTFLLTGKLWPYYYHIKLIDETIQEGKEADTRTGKAKRRAEKRSQMQPDL